MKVPLKLLTRPWRSFLFEKVRKVQTTTVGERDGERENESLIRENLHSLRAQNDEFVKGSLFLFYQSLGKELCVLSVIGIERFKI